MDNGFEPGRILEQLISEISLGKISGDAVEELRALFDQQTSEFNIESLGPVILDEAEKLMREYGKKYGLRTLDSLQLGA